MKLNKGTTLITINLIYLGRCKRLGQLKAPYAINILLRLSKHLPMLVLTSAQMMV